MLYTVKETADLSGVTIKALHHYHKIGLLKPREISEAGYRLYGREELERLQEILLYRELDFSLDAIKQILDRDTDRLSILAGQEGMLLDRKRRLEAIIGTLRQSIANLKEGIPMDDKALFKGFETVEAWNEALSGQNHHLKETYGMEPLEAAPADVQEMNEQALEAMTFMNAMAGALREGTKHTDEKVSRWIESHLAFMQKHGHPAAPKDFAAQTQFFLQDDFHLGMLENQQTGLAYYLHAAAQAYAAVHP
ncbi:MerR family transcriptional regulator [Paenibacillus sp. S-38]|uniref:MerR family transcriptional regulator n=1 Tax=Paenibacillus sp. S-38 TaxID=3416710 RepID=UPI003CE6E33F